MSSSRRYAVDERGTAVAAHCRGFTYTVHLAHPVSRAASMSMVLASAVAHQAGVPLREALSAIARSWQVPPGRGRVLRGKDGRLLIDSTYNATPSAMADALRFLRELAPDRRRVAVLGDMRELGDHAGEAHRALIPEHHRLMRPRDSRRAAHGSVRRAARSGRNASRWRRLARPGASRRGHSAPRARGRGTSKGSQNTLFLERLTEALLADPGTRRASRAAARTGTRSVPGLPEAGAPVPCMIPFAPPAQHEDHPRARSTSRAPGPLGHAHGRVREMEAALEAPYGHRASRDSGSTRIACTGRRHRHRRDPLTAGLSEGESDRTGIASPSFGILPLSLSSYSSRSPPRPRSSWSRRG